MELNVQLKAARERANQTQFEATREIGITYTMYRRAEVDNITPVSKLHQKPIQRYIKKYLKEK